MSKARASQPALPSTLLPFCTSPMNYIDSYLLFTLKLLKELFLLTASSAIISRQCPVDAIIGSIRAEVALRQKLAAKALSGHSFVAHRYALAAASGWLESREIFAVCAPPRIGCRDQRTHPQWVRSPVSPAAISQIPV